MSVERVDPLLAAEIRVAAGLDQAVAGILAPFWRSLAAEPGRPSGHLWFLRHERQDPRLEIFVHGPEERRDALARELEERARSFVASRPPARDERRSPTFDRQDYRRDPLLLGPPPLREDDRYTTLLYGCLSAGCAYALSRFELGDGARLAYSKRQRLLLEILASALDALWPTPAERLDYLVYHRDWAVRFPVLRSRRGPRKARQILARYEGELERMATASRSVLHRFAEICGDDHGDNGHAELGRTPDELAWRRSLRALRDYLEPRRDEPGWRLDPFAPGPLRPTVLKILHSVANQLGLDVLNEGLGHHLLIGALSSAAGGNGATGSVAGTAAGRATDARPIAIVPIELAPGAGATESSATDGERGRFDFEHEYLWIGLVASTGEAGERWRQSYREHGSELGGRISESMGLMRRSEVAAGKALLDRVAERRERLREREPGVHHVLGRFYYGSLAYYHYRQGDLEAVDRDMEAVADEIRGAVEHERCLLPFAALTTDVPLKRARIAREQRRWDEVAEQLEIFRDMKLDRIPLCALADGTAVYHRTIAERIAAVPSLDDEHRPALRYLQDVELRRDQLARTIEGFYTPSGFFVAYS